MNNSIGIIGGDNRNIELGRILEKEGFLVKIYSKEKDINSFLSNVDCIIGGIPFSRDDEFINFNNGDEKVSIEELFTNMKECKTLIAGAFSSKVRELATKYKINLYDFLDDEDFAIYNAIPTAEGAIEIAMNSSQITIHSSNCLILGFGRIGKILADMLSGLHANVYVAARKKEDFAWIKSMGYIPLEYKNLKDVLTNINFLFNTVPVTLIKEEELNCIKEDSLIIDLASKPGGIDFNKANEKEISTIWALGLPGKVAYKSVSRYMRGKVLEVIKNENI